jgi:hypothetical protein
MLWLSASVARDGATTWWKLSTAPTERADFAQ